MRLGIVLSPQDSWQFFNEIFDDLKAHYEVDEFRIQHIKSPVFYERINRNYFNFKLNNFMKTNDVVFFEWASGLLAAASQLRKQSGIVTRMHSFELFEWAPKINLDSVDKVILVSNAMRNRFIDLYPDQIHKAEVVYNGISLDVFKPPTQRNFNFNLGMLCNINPIKRVYEIILVVYELIKQGYDARLHIAGAPAGDMRYPTAVYQLVDKLGLKDAVQFYQHVSDSATWLRGIDIFISNSYWEGQQVSLLEAMATGCYCLSHHWDGAEEILPEESLYLTNSELSEKILRYCEIPEAEKQKHVDRMRAIASEKFDIEDVKDRIRGIIEEVGVKYN